MTEPTKRPRGRQPGAVIVSPEDRKKTGSIRLSEARWAKLRALGGTWLEEAIDRAKLPATG
jgi:hypothetical protein